MALFWSYQQAQLNFKQETLLKIEYQKQLNNFRHNTE